MAITFPVVTPHGIREMTELERAAFEWSRTPPLQRLEIQVQQLQEKMADFKLQMDILNRSMQELTRLIPKEPD